MLPDLNRLKVFYHVYRLNSIKMAADTLFLTQPGISRHIQKLESEINTPLFIRRHKKIIPTRAADTLFLFVKPFIEDLAQRIDHISKPMNQPFGLLRIGAPLEFGKTYLPGICSNFRKTYNQVRFKIIFEEPDRLLEMLNSNVIDFSILDYFSAKDQFLGRPEQYRIRRLARETFVLACSQKYFQMRLNNDISFESLVAQDFLTDEHEPVILKHWFWHYFKKTIPKVNIVMAIESHPALLECIRLDMGLAITAYHLIQKEVEKGVIVPIFPGKDKVINQISLVQLRGKQPTLTEVVFQEFIMEQVTENQTIKKQSCLSNKP